VFGVLPAGLYFWGSRSSTFDVQTVEVEGCERVSEKRALSLLEKRFLGRNLFKVREAAVEKALSPLLFAAGVEVDRDFPSTLRVRVCEHEPGLYVLAGKRWYLVSTEAVVLGEVAEESREQDVAVKQGPKGVSRKLPAMLSSAKRLKPDETVEGGAVWSALRVLDAMPEGSRQEVRSLVVRDDGVRVWMRDGLVVDVGSATRLTAKTMALDAVLDHYRTEKVACRYVDVSVPDRPVARPML
jgi:cell division septal protein FtsQ